MVHMPPYSHSGRSLLGRTVGTGIRAIRLLLRGSVGSGRWVTRRAGHARARGAGGEVGMVRLFDLHAVSCAGDTLIAIGLAGTIFFNVPLGEARSKVALYLLITMVPFALLAPVVGPLLDHFRHGRRYALATTMLGRAFLAYVISDNLLGFGLYPAAFGVLALSRAYGVARSAAVPRLLPEGVGLSQVGARASVYGTFAGAIVAPIGLAAFWFGPQWSLRVASVIFVIGMVIALRLPPRADSDPPEAVPRPFRTMLRLRRGPDRPLSGQLVINTLIGSASLRLLYGFLLLFFAFAIKAGQLSTTVLGRDIGSQGAVALVGGALVVGTFLATAIGTRLSIRRPTALQSSGLTITAGVAVLALIFYNLTMVALLALVAAIFSGISKLAIDASIQERVPERLRASAFAHSETVLMVAWVLGGAIGIIPLDGRIGVALAALIAVAAAVRAGIVATRLRGERLHGRPDTSADTPPGSAPGSAGAGPEAAGSGSGYAGSAPGSAPESGSEPGSGRSGAEHRRRVPAAPDNRAPSTPTFSNEPADPWPDAPTVAPTSAGNPLPGPARRPAPPPRDRRHEDQTTVVHPSDTTDRSEKLDTTLVEPPAPKKRFGWRRKSRSTPPSPAPSSATSGRPSSTASGRPSSTRDADAERATSVDPGRPGSATSGQATAPSARESDPAMAPPGFHIYRPSAPPADNGDDRR
jgi:hypothetical protein